MVFSFMEDRFDISDTPRSGRPSGFHGRLNTIHNGPGQCTRELINVLNWDYSTIVQHWHGQGSKIGCMGTACYKPKPQKSASGYCASLLARHRLAREQHRPFLS